MAHCPFCHGDVTENLLINGGTCPLCFGEIPGEETPTDPGEEVKGQIRQQDLDRARRRALTPVFVMAPVVGIALVVAAISLRPQEKIEEIELDGSFSFEFDPLAYDPSTAPAATEVAEPKLGREAVGRQPAVANLIGRGTSAAQPTTEDLAGRLDGVRGTEAEATGGPRGSGTEVADRGDRQLAPFGSTGGSGSIEDMDFSLTASRDSMRVLESEDDIRAAVRVLFDERKGQIQQCYERALKVDSEFSGTWRLALTVGTNGKVTEHDAIAVEAGNEQFEECIESRAAGWALPGRLAKPRTFTLPLTFRARG